MFIKGDLVYYYDIWENDCGIGIVVGNKSIFTRDIYREDSSNDNTWLEIYNVKEVISIPSVRIDYVKNYFSVEDFIKEKEANIKYDRKK